MNKKVGENTPSKQIALEKRERASAEGRSAMAEIAARNAFVQKNTARLKEMRLAKEAAERDLPPPEVPAKPVKKTKLVKQPQKV